MIIAETTMYYDFWYSIHADSVMQACGNLIFDDEAHNCPNDISIYEDVDMLICKSFNNYDRHSLDRSYNAIISIT